MGSTARGAGMVLAAWGLAVAANRSSRRVQGRSMEPTLRPGDVIVTVPRVGTPPRGTIVVLRDPRDAEHAQVKRIVGLPGESVRISRGRLLVDGTGIAEPYTEGAGLEGTGLDGALHVPAGHVAVLGDGRGRSTDSRTYGPVPLDFIDAVVVARVAPRPRLFLRSAATRLAMTANDAATTAVPGH